MSSLPASREQTVQPGQPYSSSLLNALQDGEIELYRGAQGVEWLPFLGSVAASGNASPLGAGGINISVPGDMMLMLDFRHGTRIKKLRMVASATAGATMTATLYRRDYKETAPGPGISSVPIGSPMVWTNVTEARREIDVLAAVPPDGLTMTDLVVGGDTSFFIYATVAGAGSATVFVAKAQCDRLPT